MEKGIKFIIFLIIIIVVLATIGFFVYKSFRKIPIVNNRTSDVITSISIQQPNIIIRTSGILLKVEVYFVPTGTNIDPETMSRKENAIRDPYNGGLWTYEYPKDLLITNIFAKGYDKNGIISRVDLPIIGANALATALYEDEFNQNNWITYKDKDFSFEVKFPIDWQILPADNIEWLKTAKQVFSICPNYEKYCSSGSYLVILDNKSEGFNENFAYRGTDGKYFYYSFINDFPGSTNYESKMYSQVFSTFKFTNK